MNYYSAYGLSIKSEIPIPEFRAIDAGHDIQIRLENVEYQSRLAISAQPYWRINRQEAVLSFENMGTFHIINGQEIAVIPDSSVDDQVIRQFIIGTMLAILLYQRGYLVLHASSVLVGDAAIAFLGIPGSGKSSIAAALNKLGYDVITDDVAVIDTGKNPPTIFSGHHRIRLGPEIAQVLGYRQADENLFEDSSDKYSIPISNILPESPVPLFQLYTLSEGQETVIQRIPIQSAVIELVLQSIPTRWNLPEDKQHFSQCVELVKRVPLFSLQRSSKVDEIPETAKLIVNNYFG